MALRGISVSILRDASLGVDCTLNGVTSPANAPRGTAILMGVPDGNYTEDDLPAGVPVLVIERRKIGGKEYITAKPRGEKRWCMAGGNFVYSCDGRFREHVCEYPISVHDRIEG